MNPNHRIRQITQSLTGFWVGTGLCLAAGGHGGGEVPAPDAEADLVTGLPSLGDHHNTQVALMSSSRTE